MRTVLLFSVSRLKIAGLNCNKVTRVIESQNHSNNKDLLTNKLTKMEVNYCISPLQCRFLWKHPLRDNLIINNSPSELKWVIFWELFQQEQCKNCGQVLGPFPPQHIFLPQSNKKGCRAWHSHPFVIEWLHLYLSACRQSQTIHFLLSF